MHILYTYIFFDYIDAFIYINYNNATINYIFSVPYYDDLTMYRVRI